MLGRDDAGMRALVFDEFGGPLRVRDVPAPMPSRTGAVVRVGASGLCRSDWHGWQGHDPDRSRQSGQTCISGGSATG